jgi:ankyrin repeat protein
MLNYGKNVIKPFAITLVIFCFAVGAQSPDYLSIEFWERASVADVTEALQQGFNVNARSDSTSYYNMTALMFAAAYNTNPEVIKMLLAAGADTEATSGAYGFEYTALMWAVAYSENPEIVTTLLNAGADIQAETGSGYKVFMIAAANTNLPEIIEILLAARVDVNAPADSGRTALMVAAWQTHSAEVIATLLENGADTTLMDDKGKRAFDYLKENQNLSEEAKGTLQSLLR